MTQEDISKLAYMGQPLPSDANYADRMLYEYLSALYQLTRSRVIETDRGRELKLRFLTTWDHMNSKLSTLTKIAEHDAERWLKLEPYNQKWEELKKQYENDKNAESAESLINAAEEFRKEVYVG